MLEEKKSQHLGVNYVYLPNRKLYVCSNGVAFTLEEYKQGINLAEEYEKREKEGQLYDYVYAKSTGLLRRKRRRTETPQVVETVHNDSEGRGESAYSERKGSPEVQKVESEGQKEEGKKEVKKYSAFPIICGLLGFTSVISMYISTLHTATYLTDYVDVISAWLMSASVTAYNGTAFEVSVIFHNLKRNFMSVVFMFLWVLVTLFSMATTVSVFYDRFSFNETEIAEANSELDSGKLALEVLQKKEADLRSSIDFKKKDIEFRQEHEYATSAVRSELVELEKELQANLTEQQEIMEETPATVIDKVQRKESLFAFLGRLMHLESGVLEFIMSTLSAIFVNLIAPLSLTAVTEIRKRNLTK